MNKFQELLEKHVPGSCFWVKPSDIGMSVEEFTKIVTDWELGVDGFEIVGKPHRRSYGERLIDLVMIRRNPD